MTAVASSSSSSSSSSSRREGNRINSSIDHSNDTNSSNSLLRVIQKLENDISFMSSLVHKNNQNEKSLVAFVEKLQIELMLKDAKIKELEVLMILEKQSHLEDLREERSEYQKVMRRRPKTSKKKDHLLMQWVNLARPSTSDLAVNDLIVKTCKVVPSISMKAVVASSDDANKSNMFVVGDKIEGNYKRRGVWYPGTIKATLHSVIYDDGKEDAYVSCSDIRRRVMLQTTNRSYDSDNNNDNDDNDKYSKNVDDNDTIYTDIDSTDADNDELTIKTTKKAKKMKKRLV